MNILLSAFACAPNRGSEPGVGWNWALALSQQGHNVTVATQRRHQRSIEAIEAIPNNIDFIYIDLLGTGDIPGGTIGHYIYYYVWQLKLALNLMSRNRYSGYDILHHLTYGGIRTGTFLGLLPRPLIVGPLGGGESSTLRLAYGLGKRLFVKEVIRNILNSLYLCDPLALFTQFRATRIFAKTPETRDLIFPAFRDKCRILIEIGAPAVRARASKAPSDKIEILYVGRLLAWKGVALLLDAVERLADPDKYRVTIVGDGEEATTVDSAIARSRVAIKRIAKLPQSELFGLYAQADMFVFPSLHDSSGNVVLEALTFGLPVICLDRGGPPIIVGDAGTIVSTKKRSRQQVAIGLAEAIEGLTASPETRRRAETRALDRASELTWKAAAAAAYQGCSTHP